jgi:hypothetical protein
MHMEFWSAMVTSKRWLYPEMHATRTKTGKPLARYKHSRKS